jgi:hypothetical protein
LGALGVLVGVALATTAEPNRRPPNGSRIVNSTALCRVAKA